MSNYLSAIAERSNQSNNFPLMPSVPVMSTDNASLSQDFAVENFPFDSSQQKKDESGLIPSSPEQVVFKNSIVPDRINQGNQFSQNANTFNNSELIQAGIPAILPVVTKKDRFDSNDLQDNCIVSYITRHVERMIVNENNFTEEIHRYSSKKAKTETNSNENERDSAFPENLSAKNNHFKTSETKDGSVLNPPKSVEEFTEIKIRESIINPEIKQEKASTLKTISPNSFVPRITPVQFAPQNILTDSNRKNPATPKLVIGKITVEILPPAAQPATKILTRVVQTPSTENYSKMNRLNFGLGQL